MVSAEFHPSGTAESWLLPAWEIICVHTSSDHSGGCGGALPAEGDMSDLGKNNSGPEKLLAN